MAYAELDSDASSADIPYVMQQLEHRFNRSAIRNDETPLDRDTKELPRIRTQLSLAERENLKLRLDVQRLESEIDTMKAWTKSLEQENRIKTTALSEAEAFRAKFQPLQDAVEEKNAKLAQLQRNAGEAVQEANHTRAQLQSLRNANDQLNTVKAELEEYRTSYAGALTGNRVQTGYSQVQVGTNILGASQSPSPDGLGNEHTEPEKEIEALKDRLNELKWNALDYVIDLDFANKGFRIFSCEHYKTRDIPDGQNSSRQPTAGHIATKIFNEWHEDKQFVQMYTSRRQKLLSHHRAHGRVKEGRGVNPRFLRTELVAIDVARGVESNYN